MIAKEKAFPQIFLLNGFSWQLSYSA